MLEQETSRKVNEMIRGMCSFCTDSFRKGEPVNSDDLNALAELITAVNAPDSNDKLPLIGFITSGDPSGDDT
ncbi:hypothetical protein [Paenibacillus periandrae]|uniref:hypothetical protein n=1 Tax=Paenibacillus periandrae TaxID=1761741 RepID=UPI001F098418|nr:hypothetical protein [Paenibacillus periandrae]